MSRSGIILPSTMTKAKSLGKIAVRSSAFFLCDMQEKFRATISFYPEVLQVAQRMLKTADILDVPVIVTEQYPKGLGPTVSELDVSQCPVFPKTSFSMLIPAVEEHMKKLEAKSIMLCGIEAHACIQQTVLDLLEKDYDVHVLVDAVSSRNMVDRMYALQRMRDAGAFLTTSESLLLQLLKDAANPKFRDVQKLIMDPAPDSGLLSH
ncbi:Isochorismatase domain-containing protein 2 [Lamellibrachia satsuma]|nr:Isochorismatase domain-containing protein 2 [Lamellibrachia satsuma]